MDLEFSDEEAQLRDSVRDIVDGICPASVVRAIHEGTGDAGDVWRQMIELDWPGLTVPAEHGGVGMGFMELAIVADQLGRACVPGPFLATATQFVPALRELGGESSGRWLAEVAGGRITGTLALAEGGHWSADAVAAIAEPDGDGWRLTGFKDAVVDGAHADEVVVIARAAAGLGAFVVARDDLVVHQRQVLDPTITLADIELTGVTVGPDRVVAPPGPDVAVALERVIEEATVVLAVATASTCREIFDRTLQYSKEREQYGRLIGSFQALKHRFAEMYLAVERASSLCWFAALTIAEDDPRRAEATSLAKAAVGECQRRLVTDGLQLHGGIGYTWEHDLHFFLKRAKAGDALFGNSYHHRSKLAQMLGLADQERVA